MKKILLKQSNAMLSAILALFGVSSCTDADLYGSPMAEYGIPAAEYIEITGTVQNEAQQPIENIQVVSDYDMTYTSADGSFVLRREGVFPDQYMTLQFNDTDGEANGSYQNDTAEVHITYSGGDGSWNRGIGGGTVNKTLKEKTE